MAQSYVLEQSGSLLDMALRTAPRQLPCLRHGTGIRRCRSPLLVSRMC